MYRFCLQLICLPLVIFAVSQVNLAGRWDWIKSFRGGFVGGWETPADRGYSMHMVIRNDSVYTYHNDTLVQTDSVEALLRTDLGTVIETRADTLIIKQTRVEAIPATYWLKAPATNPASVKPPVLFMCSRINGAWGYVHSGRFVDTAGRVFTYSFTLADSVSSFGRADSLSAEFFVKLIAKRIVTGMVVPRDTLLRMAALIAPAAIGQLSIGGGCDDFGIYRYSAIMPGISGSKSKEVACYQLGDETVCNSSDAARTIARWLNSIDSMRIGSCAPDASCLYPTTEMAERQVGSGITVALRSAYITVKLYSLQGKLLAGPLQRLAPSGGRGTIPEGCISASQSAGAVIVEISGSGTTKYRLICSKGGE